MAVLTDILNAPVHDAPAIISEWPGEKRWPAIETTGLDGLVLEDLAVALGHPLLAEAIQDLDPAASSADEENGPWVYVLPTELRDQIADLAADDFVRVSMVWSEGEEASERELTQEIAEDILRQLIRLFVVLVKKSAHCSSGSHFRLEIEGRRRFPMAYVRMAALRRSENR